MAKIPFDIKYRPEIEAGKYEVVTRLDTPVKILCYDARGKYPIAGLVRGEATDSPQSWCIDGSFDGRNESLNDLFLVPAERELTAFESRLCEILDFAWKHKDTIKTDGDIIGDAKRLGPELLALARKELQPEKDLPRWKKCAPCDEDKATIPAWIVRFDAELAGESAVVHNGHYILFGDLEKLPKEE